MVRSKNGRSGKGRRGPLKRCPDCGFEMNFGDWEWCPICGTMNGEFEDL